MRTLIDVPEHDLDRLAELASKRKTSRAALVREAIQQFLMAQRPLRDDDAFGLWKTGESGLDYQNRLRDEW
ncbi:CopG family transcriptional regulator [uncultured Alsobacter sp.]|uniref:ribbon-helix-helix domain-containing protein n=1 Tax=uncultured Alsobacter sp. TaxID=1748258 RepID=UPI0025E09BD2|nr:CopG family transcriptional regulator [uncultured Alsobacter sp.]